MLLSTASAATVLADVLASAAVLGRLLAADGVLLLLLLDGVLLLLTRLRDALADDVLLLDGALARSS